MVDKLLFYGEPMALRCFFKNLLMLCPILIGPFILSGVPHKGWAHLSFGPMDTDPLGPLV